MKPSSPQNNETNLVHDLFLVYFVNFIYNLYMFLVCRMEFIPSCMPDSQLFRITSTKCRINTVVPPDVGPWVVRNM